MPLPLDAIPVGLPPDAVPVNGRGVPRMVGAPGMLETAARGVKQGLSLGWGDEGSAAIAAALPYLDREATAPNLSDLVKGDTFGSRYRRALEFYRNRDKRASEANPKTAVAGKVVGSIAPFLVPGVGAALAPAKGAGLAARLGQAAKVGAGIGGVSGAGEAESLADTPGQAAAGAVTGAVVGPLLQGAGEAVSAVASPIGRALRDRLGKVALEQGRKALTGNAGTISVKKPLSPESVQAAYDVGAIRPGSRVAAIAERLEGARDVAGNEYARIIQELESKGVTGPNAITLARQLMAEARNMTVTGNPAPDMFRGVAKDLVAEPSLTPNFDLPLSAAETVKRNLQNAARAEYVKEGTTSLAGATKVDLASRLRQAVEDSVQAQASKAPAEAAAFVPVKQRLGALIEAGNAANTAAAREARKSNIGLGTWMAGAAGASAGGVPGAVTAGALAKAFQSRGPATIGSIANALAKARGITSPTPAQSAALSAEAKALVEAMLRGRAQPGLVPAAAEGEQ